MGFIELIYIIWQNLLKLN